MLDAPIPADDAQRLDDLCRLSILDTPAEGRFDRITRTAQRLFDVPMALVTLVDANRQWFKSRVGLADAQTERRVSFCGHAILREGIFVIPDAHADARFADNPLVTGPPHVRFYAGMPLHGGNGWRIGTLCILDTRARAFSASDERALAELAAWAELELNTYSIGQATHVAREKEERLQAVLDHAGDGILTLGLDGRIQSINPAALQSLAAADAPRLVGRDVMDLVAPADRAGVQAALAELARRPRGVTASLRLEVGVLRTDGATFPAEISVTRMRGTAGTGYTAIVRDVSQRKQVERMKNEFISTVSHELRTPLTSVRGSLGLVLGGAVGEVPAKARTLLEIAASNCDRLVRLVNDMLDIEKIESGNVRFDLAPQPVAPLVRQALAATEAYAAGLGVRLGLHAQDEDARVEADADRLTQVLVNLLSNAAKFSPAGASVDVGVGPAPGAPGWVRITVADRGPGIPPDFRDRMFSRFLQADASDARQRAGTGLGLAISKAIVERLRGRIGFADRLGGGTEFHVDLPRLAPDPVQAGAGVVDWLSQPIDGERLLAAVRNAVPATGSQRPIVLHVEDDADLVQVVATLLQDTCDTVPAATLADAREVLARRAFDLVLLDLQLPDGNASGLLAGLPAPNADTPVVVFSGTEVSGALAAQVRDALVKTRTSNAQLLQVLQRLMRPGAEGGA